MFSNLIPLLANRFWLTAADLPGLHSPQWHLICYINNSCLSRIYLGYRPLSLYILHLQQLGHVTHCGHGLAAQFVQDSHFLGVIAVGAGHDFAKTVQTAGAHPVAQGFVLRPLGLVGHHGAHVATQIFGEGYVAA